MSLTPQFGEITPSQKQELLNSNYLKFNDGGAGNTDTFAQQYLPEIYEQEVERYGNRTLSGFLRMVGAEMPMTSDQVIWSEQNRLHISYEDVAQTGGAGLELTIPVNGGTIQNVISPRATIVVLDPATGLEAKCLVTDSNTATGVLAVMPYTVATLGALSATGLKIFVFGSEYAKGGSVFAGTDGGPNGTTQYVSVDPQFTQHSNSPIILKSQYVVSGSDMAQIGWVEVATEDGTSGYLWYLKAESETRLRFEDYLEMAMIEGEIATGAAAASAKGTEGLFAAIEDRGNVNVGFTAAAGLNAFDDILKNLDTQGAIEENMLFLKRQTALDFDDMLS
ncbi:MAG: hypothetical protein GY787_16925, partial [Alteromonadales bacterium]|nr:hypothetical protein [Alteromonadales bacterium]